jgi:uncharacterized protein YqfA (UPF0365 family)
MIENIYNISLLTVFTVIALGLFYLFVSVFSLWFQASASNATVSISQLVGMRLRKVNSKMIVEAYILSVKAGFPIEINSLEAHYLSGGNVLKVVQAFITAKKENKDITFEKIAAMDLNGEYLIS